MRFEFVPMTREYAEEIAYQWKYEGIYSFYDMTADREDLGEFLDEAGWPYKFAVLDEGKELVGYYSYYLDDGGMWIGFGLRPDLTGKGYGADFVLAGIDFGLGHFGFCGKHVMLAVAKFNRRAINVYEKIGFEAVEEYIQDTNGGKYEFLKMRLKLD